MTKSTRTYNRRGSKRLRTGKYHDKYKIVLKPVEYKKQLAEWNNKDKYEDGPLITFYANVWERTRQETKPEHYEWKKEVETLMQESL